MSTVTAPAFASIWDPACNPHLFVVGPIGSGKTTVLDHIIDYGRNELGASIWLIHGAFLPQTRRNGDRDGASLDEVTKLLDQVHAEMKQRYEVLQNRLELAARPTAAPAFTPIFVVVDALDALASRVLGPNLEGDRYLTQSLEAILSLGRVVRIHLVAGATGTVPFSVLDNASVLLTGSVSPANARLVFGGSQIVPAPPGSAWYFDHTRTPREVSIPLTF